MIQNKEKCHHREKTKLNLHKKADCHPNHKKNIFSKTPTPFYFRNSFPHPLETRDCAKHIPPYAYRSKMYQEIQVPRAAFLKKKFKKKKKPPFLLSLMITNRASKGYQVEPSSSDSTP